MCEQGGEFDGGGGGGGGGGDDRLITDHSSICHCLVAVAVAVWRTCGAVLVNCHGVTSLRSPCYQLDIEVSLINSRDPHATMHRKQDNQCQLVVWWHRTTTRTHTHTRINDAEIAHR